MNLLTKRKGSKRFRLKIYKKNQNKTKIRTSYRLKKNTKKTMKGSQALLF